MTFYFAFYIIYVLIQSYTKRENIKMRKLFRAERAMKRNFWRKVTDWWVDLVYTYIFKEVIGKNYKHNFNFYKSNIFYQMHAAKRT